MTSISKGEDQVLLKPTDERAEGIFFYVNILFSREREEQAKE